MAEGRNGDAKGGGGGVVIDQELLATRLKVFYRAWTEGKEKLWNGADAVGVLTPRTSEDLRYLKSTALHVWLLGYEFPETVMVFLHTRKLHIVCSQKKAGMLEALRKSVRQQAQVELFIHVRPRNEAGGTEMDSILQSVKQELKKDIPVVGVLAKESAEGAVMEKWEEVLAESGASKVDVSSALAELLLVKDEKEISYIKRASFLSASVMKSFVVPKLEVAIDEEEKITHAELMEKTEEVILEPSKVKVNYKPENVDICFPPVFQSGGTFDLKPSALSNDDQLYYDATGVIICALGARYASYCSNVARTYLIDADKFQEKAYKILLKAHEAAINALKPDSPMSAPYQAALGVVQKEAPELASSLTKNAGTSIGIEFRESGSNLNAKNDHPVKAGMVFNVNVGFQNLSTEQPKDPRTAKFSLLLADTVVVGSSKGAEVLTNACTKSFNDIAYSFKDDEEEEPEEPQQRKTRPKPDANGGESSGHKTSLRSDTQEMTKEEQRRLHQQELARQKNEETARRLAAGGSGQGDGQGSTRVSGDIVAYRNVDDIPMVREPMIQVATRTNISVIGFL